MSEDKTRVTVDIFGTPYKLTGNANSGHMRRVAEMVDEQMKRIAKDFPRLDVPRIAVLAAVNLADNFLKQSEQSERKKAGLQHNMAEEHKELEQRLQHLEQTHKAKLTELTDAANRENALRQEMSRLQEEYEKLKGEFNEWIQLVNADPGENRPTS